MGDRMSTLGTAEGRVVDLPFFDPAGDRMNA